MAIIGQSTSANIIIGPILNQSASIMVTLDIDNDAIWLHKNGGASAARAATTSALSVSPGFYRIVLSTADTDTLGELVVVASGSGAILFRKDVEIWQKPSWDLYYGSADQLLGSAAASALISSFTMTSASLSSQINTALVNRSAAVSAIVLQAINDSDIQMSATFSAQMSAMLDSYRGIGVATSGGAGASQQEVSVAVAQALTDRQVPSSAAMSVLISVGVNNALVNRSAATSGIVAQAISDFDYGAAVSGNVSVAVEQALSDRQVPSSAAISAIVQAVHEGRSAAISAIVLQAINDSDVQMSATFSAQLSAAMGSYRGIGVNTSGGGGLTQDQVSAVVLQALQDQLLHTLVANSASVTAVNANSLIGRIMATADPLDYDRTTDSLAAIADAGGAGGITSAAASILISAVVQRIFDSEDLATSAAVSADQALLSAQIAGISALILTSAQHSVIAAQAISDASAGASARNAQAIADAKDWLVSANISTALSAYAGLGVATSGGAGASQQEVSVAVAQALADYDVPTSADVSVLVSVGVNAALANRSAATSAIVAQAISDAKDWLVSANLSTALSAYAGVGVATSGGAGLTSAQVSVINAQALSDYAALTSAGFSAQLSTGLAGYAGQGVAVSGDGTNGIGSANASVLISTVVQGILDNNQIPSSAEVSAIVIQALTDRGVLVSANLSTALSAYAGVGVATSGGAGLTSAQVSTINAQALSDYGALVSANLSAALSVGLSTAFEGWGVPTSANISVMVSSIVQNIAMTSASLSSQIETALTNHAVLTSTGFSAQLSVAMNSYQGIGVATSGGTGLTSAATSIIVAQAISDASAAASARNAQAISDAGLLVSANLSTALSAYAGAGVAISGGAAGISSADMSVLLGNYGGVGVATSGEALTSGETSVVAAQALSDAGLLVSGNLSAGIEQAVFQRSMDEPTGAPSWAGMNYDVAIEWMAARNTNRQHQSSTSVAIYNSADSQIASASIGITSTSANQDQFL